MPDTKSGNSFFWWVLACALVIAVRTDIGTLEKRVMNITTRDNDRLAALEEEAERNRKAPGPVALWQYFRRVRDLERRVLTPRFGRHAGTCAQCRGDVPSEEGGPSPLCARGFALWQQDLREQQAADVAEGAASAEASASPEEPAE